MFRRVWMQFIVASALSLCGAVDSHNSDFGDFSTPMKKESPYLFIYEPKNTNYKKFTKGNKKIIIRTVIYNNNY